MVHLHGAELIALASIDLLGEMIIAIVIATEVMKGTVLQDIQSKS
jgi:hypothetical protein